MLALVLLTVANAVAQSCDAETWSVIAAKWVVPFTLYLLAGVVFNTEAALRAFEIFFLVVLGYLSLTAILFLVGAKSWIFPAFIVDESIGIHADRARGPFLQAVANGVTLNLLGVIALDCYRRHRLKGILALLFLIALAFGHPRHQNPRGVDILRAFRFWRCCFFRRVPGFAAPASVWFWRRCSVPSACSLLKI